MFGKFEKRKKKQSKVQPNTISKRLYVCAPLRSHLEGTVKTHAVKHAIGQSKENKTHREVVRYIWILLQEIEPHVAHTRRLNAKPDVLFAGARVATRVQEPRNKFLGQTDPFLQ